MQTWVQGSDMTGFFLNMTPQGFILKEIIQLHSALEH
jgi:hypothetical protein